MALRIGVVADTHIHAAGRPLPGALLAALDGVDAILHAGDIACRAVLESLAAVAPVHAVHGNGDPPDLQRDLPERLVLEFGAVRIGLTHGHLGRGSTTLERARAQFLDVQDLSAIVFGHSHVPTYEVRDGIALFNPGSPTQPRRQPRPTYGLLTIDGGLSAATIVALDR